MPWGNNGKGKGPWGSQTPPPSNENQPKRPQGADFDEALRKGAEKLKGVFGGGKGGNLRPLLVILFVAFIAWMASGIYEVDEKEQGVVMRLGAFHRTVPPGLHYRLPTPFETVKIVPVTLVNRVEIGLRSRSFGRSGDSQVVEIPEESSMLTGDENIVDVPFEVQWVISDAQAFLFNVHDPESTVKSVAESAMREVIGRTPIAEAISGGKFKIQSEARELLQKILDGYNAGVSVIALELGKVKYPTAVRPAFTDVQNAKTEAESTVNKATAYRNEILNRAKGIEAQIIADAEAYREQVVSRAKGEASRFNAVFEEYRNAKDVTRKRMYLETMEEMLAGMDKILIDQQSGAGGVVPYLPLNELRKQPAQKED